MPHYYVYILTSPTGTLYTGVTNDLKKRMYQHKHKLIDGFTKKYNVTRLVYYEQIPDVQAALAREKQVRNPGINFRGFPDALSGVSPRRSRITL